MVNTSTKEFSISSYDLDPKGQAKLTTLANFLQEMAYYHAGQLGFGYDDMNERQTMWVLSRMRIRINHYPVWNDRVRVETWHKGMERLFGLRDFRVSDNSGGILGVASTAWLILDNQTRRPVRSTEEVLHLGRNDESVFEEKLEKIRLPDEMEALNHRKVLFSDLDIIGHVNNVKYMEWCIDAATTELNTDREIREIEINFMHEALLGDEIIISGVEESGMNMVNESFFVATREGDRQEIFRACLRWD
ncbi:MAG: acyl-ACP thioesterase domain-containing protein [Bacteroidota bacterium]